MIVMLVKSRGYQIARKMKEVQIVPRGKNKGSNELNLGYEVVKLL